MDVGTPTKPKRSNPYAQTPSPVHNPYAKKSSSTSPVRNPYAKSPSATSPPRGTCHSSAKRPHANDDAVSSCKRKISFASSDCKPAAGASTAAVNLGSDFSDSKRPAIDVDRTYILYFDGGSRGNPGVAGAGMVIYDGEKEIWSGHQYLGDHKTNNEAEYTGLVTGLDCAVRLGIHRIHVNGDSKLIIKQTMGEWQCNKPHLRGLLQKVVESRGQFKAFSMAHVYRKDNKRADELANRAMDEKSTDLGGLPVLVTPPLSQASREDDAMNSMEFRVEESEAQNDPIDQLCSLTFSQSITDADLLAVDDGDWAAKLPFLVQFELERLGLRKDLRSSDFGSRLKGAFDEHRGKSSLRQELVALIHEEDTAQTVPATYMDLLELSSEKGVAVDKSNSCLMLFQAKKLCEGGLELLRPQVGTAETRRIHRRFGGHRFLDLYCDSKCTESLSVLKKHLRKHLVNEKLVLAGRKYGILYSNPSGKKVTFRLFVESGVGIDKCDEISAPEVAKRCIPLDLNPGLSLTKYMKRMKLSFTSTIPTLILEPGMLEQIDDIKAAGTGNEMTDGCGLISREALNKVYMEYTLNREQRNRDIGTSVQTAHAGAGSCPYSSFQGRIGGLKGIWVVDDSLNGIKVCYRESQKKYCVPLTERGTIPLVNDDQNVVAILEARGVPAEFFLELARKEIEELASIRTDHALLVARYKARMFLRDSESLFDDDVFLAMLVADVNLDEPTMLKKLNDFVNSELKSLREKSRFPESSSRYLRMLPDHTGLLKPDEAFVATGEGPSQSEVDAVGSIIAMRLPSYFLSDLRKLKAVSKVDLIRRGQARGLDPSKGSFFSGIIAGLVLSTKGPVSQAEMMSGGDFDGDKAWCCWNKTVVSSVGDWPDRNDSPQQPDDPFKKRLMQWEDEGFSNLVINYTMQHRKDKMYLGTLVKTLESMRDNPRFDASEADMIARKAFVQVDNPHVSQWSIRDKQKYGSMLRPHWQATGKAGNTYHSNKALGQLFDLLSEGGAKSFAVGDIEDEMNEFIRAKVERALKKDPA
ncbi:hypothetical protein ACHAXT_013033 [Thalassiosira profunda]